MTIWSPPLNIVELGFFCSTDQEAAVTIIILFHQQLVSLCEGDTMTGYEPKPIGNNIKAQSLSA